jgi:hypothetical protein
MKLDTSMHKRTFLSVPRSAQHGVLALSAKFPAWDALLLVAIALLALSVFEVAAWLAAASLSTLVCSVAFVPTVLFLVAVCSERAR